MAKGAVEVDSDERPGITLEWRLLSAGQLRAQWLVAIHPDFASYHPRLGLRLGDGGPPPPAVFNERPFCTTLRLPFESWVKHCQRITARRAPCGPSHARGVKLLAAKYRVPEEWIEQLVEIACALHDTGQTRSGMAESAWLWQDHKDARAREAGFPVPVRPRVPIAHTWFSPKWTGIFKRQYRFPPHATQGAFAVLRCARRSPHCFGRRGLGAIGREMCRHRDRPPSRNPHARVYSIPPAARSRADNCGSNPGGWPGLELQECADPLSRDQFPEVLLTFGVNTDEHAWPLYAFLVRRLRLADQAATAGDSNELSS